MRDDDNTVELTPDLLLQAYTMGIFPMGSDEGDRSLYWVDPHERGIIPLDKFHASKSLRKTIRRGKFQVRIDADFRGTRLDCADREETWINDTILNLYTALHGRGRAHSVEIWQNDTRVGGLYGVSIGKAFFGESMFSNVKDASKIALVYLVARLRAGGYTLLDTQFTTDHLTSMGGIGVARSEYQLRLHLALGGRADFMALGTDADAVTVLSYALQS